MSISSYINEDINKIDEIYKLHREIEKIFYEEFQRYLARKIFEDVFIVFAKVIKIKKYLTKGRHSLLPIYSFKMLRKN